MKHQRTPTIIEDSSDDESLAQGPLCKRQKRAGMAAALTLESLIRAGEVLNQEDSVKSELEELPRRSGRVTPTRELQLHQGKEKDIKLVHTALCDTLAAIENDSKPVRIPTALPALTAVNKDWSKYCRPLAAPPRLPNVPFGFSVQEKRRGAISA